MPTPDPVPTSLVAVLIIAVTALAGVIVYLWRHYANQEKDREKERLKREVDFANERAGWAAERAKLEARSDVVRDEIEAEYEAKFREVLEASRKHEDEIRRDFARNIDVIAAQANASTDKIVTVLDKFYERYVGQRLPYGRDKG